MQQILHRIMTDNGPKQQKKPRFSSLMYSCKSLKNGRRVLMLAS